MEAPPRTKNQLSSGGRTPDHSLYICVLHSKGPRKVSVNQRLTIS